MILFCKETLLEAMPLLPSSIPKNIPILKQWFGTATEECIGDLPEHAFRFNMGFVPPKTPKMLLPRKLLEQPRSAYFRCFYSGSRTIAGAARPDSDLDVVFDATGLKKSAQILKAAGWKISRDGGSGSDGDMSPDRTAWNPLPKNSFRTWRKGDVNLIEALHAKFYYLFFTATVLSIRHKIVDKQERVTLFQAILYGTLTDRIIGSTPLITDDGARP